MRMAPQNSVALNREKKLTEAQEMREEEAIPSIVFFFREEGGHGKYSYSNTPKSSHNT